MLNAVAPPCGSMGKAAALLSVSQPAISKAIAELEYTLGVPLLDRNPRGVEPTIYGRVLLDRGLVAFDELRQAVKHIEFLADPTAGEVRVATPVILASGFVAAVADRLSRKYPRVVVHLVAAESAMTYRALEERKVELVVVGIFEPVVQQHLNSEILYQEFLCCRGRRTKSMDQATPNKACRSGERNMDPAAPG